MTDLAQLSVRHANARSRKIDKLKAKLSTQCVNSKNETVKTF